MVFRQIQRFKIEVIFLDFRAFLDGEAHAEEDVLDALERQRQRMQMAERLRAARQRDVDFLACELVRECARLELLVLLGNQRLDLRLRLVDDLADLRAILFREGAHAAQDGREFALLAEELDADVIELREIPGRMLDGFGSLCLQLFDLFFHHREKLPPKKETMNTGGENKKAPSPPCSRGGDMSSRYHPDLLLSLKSRARPASGLPRRLALPPAAPKGTSQPAPSSLSSNGTLFRRT